MAKLTTYLAQFSEGHEPIIFLSWHDEMILGFHHRQLRELRLGIWQGEPGPDCCVGP